MNRKTRAVLETLKETYPEAGCSLDHETPLQLLTSTVLSAQTTDKSVNKVTRVMYREHPDLDSLLTLSREQIIGYIHPLGFYRIKADHLYDMWRKIKSDFGGEVPQTMEGLTSLPGVGRKTANVVLSNAFGVPAIAVDTHVFRVSNRIGLAHARTVEETEEQLKKAIDQDWWSLSHHLLIYHGRAVCDARKPLCGECPVARFCEFYAARRL